MLSLWEIRSSAWKCSASSKRAEMQDCVNSGDSLTAIEWCLSELSLDLDSLLQAFNTVPVTSLCQGFVYRTKINHIFFIELKKLSGHFEVKFLTSYLVISRE